MDEGVIYRGPELGRISRVGFGSQVDGGTHWTLGWRGRVSSQGSLGHRESPSCPQTGSQGYAEF